jgi:hypothetical protein
MNALTAFLKQQITKNLGGASAAGNGARKISQWLPAARRFPAKYCGRCRLSTTYNLTVCR